MQTKKLALPAACTDAHLLYLDDLRESGATNMWGACSFLERAYPNLDRKDSNAILDYWMDSFTARHNK
jgi:hypothetical protein